MRNLFKRFLVLSLLIIVAAVSVPAIAEETHDPIDPATIAKSELFTHIWLYPYEGKVWRVDLEKPSNKPEVGEDGWLTNVYVEKVYFVNKYYMVIEGQFDDEIHGVQPWLMLSALNEDGHVGFGRYITANAFSAFYVDPKQIGYTNVSGQTCIGNIHGDLFWPPASCS